MTLDCSRERVWPLVCVTTTEMIWFWWRWKGGDFDWWWIGWRPKTYLFYKIRINTDFFYTVNVLFKKQPADFFIYSWHCCQTYWFHTIFSNNTPPKLAKLNYATMLIRKNTADCKKMTYIPNNVKRKLKKNLYTSYIFWISSIKIKINLCQKT